MTATDEEVLVDLGDEAAEDVEIVEGETVVVEDKESLPASARSS